MMITFIVNFMYGKRIVKPSPEDKAPRAESLKNVGSGWILDVPYQKRGNS